MLDVGMVRELQERAARALPAARVVRMDGWLLRQAPGCSWWVGTVLPHGVPVDLAGRVTSVERFYAGAARFQITAGVCPPSLDGLLADRGYERGGTMSLMTARAVQAPRAATLTEHPTRRWFEAWHAVHGGDPAAEWNLLTRVTRPSAYAAVLDGDTIIAVGRAVADTGWTGVFGMATRPEARGRGAAAAILATLSDWATAHGERLYLQVERDNLPARALYSRAGFREVAGYHYRSAP
jgi:GNAT superfamily N-acetyltransferase